MSGTPQARQHRRLSLKRSNPSISVRLQEMIDEGELPPCYHQNPIVQNSDSPVVPVSLFCDGVPYSNDDSLVGYWLINEITQSRHLLAGLRKKICCKCGCRGWCTFFEIFLFLVWGLRACADAAFPSVRHDGKAWGPLDVARSMRAGVAMRFKCCLIYIKGDWAEYNSTMGLPPHNDGMRPCWECNTTIEEMFRIDNISPAGLPWRPNDDGDYDIACRRCEKPVQINRRQHDMLREVLKEDRRSQGSHGFAVTGAIPELELIVGDRLEATPTMPNVATFFSINEYPASVLFWRPSSDTLTRRRNPLFDSSLGITVHRSLTIDVLHDLYLGVMNIFCHFVVWWMIGKHIWEAHLLHRLKWFGNPSRPRCFLSQTPS